MADVEIWMPVPEFEGYEASNLGRIRSIDRWVTYKNGQRRFYRGRVLRKQNGPSGYPTVHPGYKHQHRYVHHLVMQAFKGETPSGFEICHNDGDKRNCRLDNLRFDTRLNNVFDVVRHKYEQAWLSYAAHPVGPTRAVGILKRHR